MTDQSPPDRHLRLHDLLRIGVGKMMLLSGAFTLLFWAWLFNRENANSETAIASYNLSELNHEDPKHRLAGAEDLRSIPPHYFERTIQALAASLRDEDWKVRRAAANSLVLVIGGHTEQRQGEVQEQIDFVAEALVRVFNDPNLEVRAEAANAIARLHLQSPGVVGAQLIPHTGRVGPDPARVLKPLAKLMRDPDAHIRSCAVNSYAWIAHANLEDPGPILEMSDNDSSSMVRTSAIQALLRHWENQIELYPLVLRELKRAKNNDERQPLAWMLGSVQIGLPTLEMLPSLIDFLKFDDPILRRNVPKAISFISPPARSALPALLTIARQELSDEDYEFPAVEAIIAINPDSPEAQELIDPLVLLLKRSDQGNRSGTAGGALTIFGKAGVAAVPGLREALKNRDPAVRRRAALVLKSIGPGAIAASDDLIRQFSEEPDPINRTYYEEAIAAIGNH